MMRAEYLEAASPTTGVPVSRLNVRRLFATGAQLVGGLVIAALVFPFASPGARLTFAQQWARRMIGALGARLCVEGAAPAPGTLLVANHVSWLDILAIASHTPAAFVAKSEVRAWPAIGWLAARAGTLFLRRSSGRSLLRVKERIGALLLEGRNVTLFAEGTTTGGSGLLPFRSGLMQAAVDSIRPVQAVAIAYYDGDGRLSAAAAFIDTMSLWESIGAILRCGPITARLVITPPLAPAGRTRKQLAREAHQLVAAILERPRSAVAFPIRPTNVSTLPRPSGLEECGCADSPRDARGAEGLPARDGLPDRVPGAAGDACS
jgi:1-acyl-sn-glycerol-3-phosphate acyltransferase